ncbi:MAG: arginine repressor [Actinomycetota bacterium]|nr:arginine repressor [Actinomycetota bacterium]
MKRQRHEAITRLVKTGVVQTQRELGKLLKDQGFEVSQATISRDIAELGIRRVRDENKVIRYVTADSTSAGHDPGEALRRMAPEFLLSTEACGNLIVVKTTPGGAPGLALAIDQAEIEGVAGTIAGDDAILVVCSNGTGSKDVEGKLVDYCFGQGVKKIGR